MKLKHSLKIENCKLKITAGVAFMNEFLKVLAITLAPLTLILLLPAPAARAAVTTVTTLSMPNNSLGLVGHWTFDGKDMINNVADSSGQGNTGILQSFTSTTTTAGAVGQALSFNGTNNYVSTATNQGNGSMLQTITISAWFKTTTASGNNIIALETAQTGTGSASFDREIYVGTDGKVYGRVYDTASKIAVSSKTYTDGQWHLATVTIASGAFITLYVDGTFQQKTAIGTPWSAYTTSFWRIGSYQAGGTNEVSGYFSGSIDDVRIYNRALSAAEVQQLYNQGTATHQNTTINPPNLQRGLVGHWTFDGKDMINNVADSSGQGNTGLLTGATSTIPGVLGQAISFSGQNNFVNPINSYSFSSTTYTLALWVNTASTSESIIGLTSGGCGANESYLALTGGKPIVALHRGSCNPNASVTGPKAINDKAWHFLVGIISRFDIGATSGVTLYVDGVSAGTANATAGSNAGTKPLKIGDPICSSCTGNNFNGSLDDARIYNRALSAAEVMQLYQQGTATHQNTTINPPNLQRGLVGHWTFDGKDMINNVADTSGQGNNGSLASFTSTTTVQGVLGQALNFGGSKEIDVGNTTSLNIAGNTITMSAWVYEPRYTGAASLPADGYIMGKSNNSWTYGLSISGGSQSILVDISSPGACSHNFGGNGLRYMTGRWDLVTAVYNGTNIYEYVNGNLIFTCAKTGNISTNSDILVIGKQGQNHGASFTGTLDDVRIYNRALTAAEVYQLYQLGH